MGDRRRVALPMRTVICRADACGTVLGETDGRRLYLATCWFARSVTLHCNHCGQRNVWSPPPGQPTGTPNLGAGAHIRR